MTRLLDQLRAQLTERRADLVAELAELDDALGRLGAETEPTFVDRQEPKPQVRAGGRPPSQASLFLEKWIVGWALESGERIILADECYKAAVEAGQVPGDRNGRERVRTALERIARRGDGQVVGGGRYRVYESAALH